MIRISFFFLLLFVLSEMISTAQATEFVRTKGRMSDTDFYRAVSCAAPPGGECQRRILRWSKDKRGDITVGIWRIDDGYPSKSRRIAMAALLNAIKEINGVGSSVQMRLVDDRTPDIKVMLIDGAIAREATSDGTLKDFALLDGAGGMARVYSGRKRGIIDRAEVMLTNDLPDNTINSVMLEEVIQSLGLLTDIHNRYYAKRSIFSEIGSRVTRLKGQDAKTLLLHYPAN